ncbi:MAG TPA: HAD family hydrolase [Longimicrobiaceae bacterium]|jgi:3-deoxy-D-manno-octulosonate 8-phosphate phosphatase (KDO 8-P phosphatase)|nr:HAD family hydrolase [Longimicrobiaceae bacterium]
MAEARGITAEVARAIRLVVLDVDGVLTDGGIYLGATDAGERIETKRYEITDGIGVQLLQERGIEVAIVTGRESRSVAMRAAELSITECHQDATAHKLRIVARMIDRLGIAWHEVAHVGDDLADIPVLRRVGLPVAVANAVPEVRAVTAWRSRRRGGAGAIREFAEALLQARGEWAAAVERYLAPREILP